MSDIRNMAASPENFRRAVLIDTDAGPRPFGDVADPWQLEDFQALDNAWLRACGHGADGGQQRAYLERPRGHSKTLDLAIAAAWALTFSQRPLSGIAAAADRDQARLLRDAIKKLVRLNDLLGRILSVQNYRVVNEHTGSSLDIISSDVATSYGLTPDFIVADELVHWQSRDLWDSLISAAAKRSHCVLICISNAGLGMGSSWQWEVREQARLDPSWYFSRIDGPVASWITEDRLQEQQRMLPPKVYARLWNNQWTTEHGDALDQRLIEEALTLDGPPEDPTIGQFFVGGLDLSIRRDRSAFVVLGFNPSKGKLFLAGVRHWNPQQMGGEVILSDVQDAVMSVHRAVGLLSLRCDAFGAHQMAQYFGEIGIDTYCHNQSLSDHTEQAKCLLQVFQDRAIELYNDPRLIADLQQLRIVERSGSKLKFEADRESTGGHADSGFALCNAIHQAVLELDGSVVHSGAEGDEITQLSI